MSGGAAERRQFYRHPMDVPIQVFPGKEQTEQAPMSDLSAGGMAFITNVFIESGAMLTIRIPYVEPAFEARCVACWQRRVDGRFEVGVMFLDEQTAFRVRMVEQVCQIKRYHAEQRRAGRGLSFEQAACEWIDRYAEHFGRDA